MDELKVDESTSESDDNHDLYPDLIDYVIGQPFGFIKFCMHPSMEKLAKALKASKEDLNS